MSNTMWDGIAAKEFFDKLAANCESKLADMQTDKADSNALSAQMGKCDLLTELPNLSFDKKSLVRFLEGISPFTIEVPAGTPNSDLYMQGFHKMAQEVLEDIRLALHPFQKAMA